MPHLSAWTYWALTCLFLGIAGGIVGEFHEDFQSIPRVFKRKIKLSDGYNWIACGPRYSSVLLFCAAGVLWGFLATLAAIKL